MRYHYLRDNVTYEDEELLSEAIRYWLSCNVNGYPSDEEVQDEIDNQVEEWLV